MIELETARVLLQNFCHAWKKQQHSSTQQSSISDSLGLSLAEDIHAKIAVPIENLAAMDGYALCLNSTQIDEGVQAGEHFALVGESRAGKPFAPKNKELSPGQCIRIMTGAVVPNNAHTVVMQENISVLNTQILHTHSATAINTDHNSVDDVVRLNQATTVQKNIRYAGEDIAQAQLLFMRDERITPSTISALASQGISYIKTHRPLKIGFFSSGDELRKPSETLHSGNIFESNLNMIAALLKPLPVELHNLGIIADKPHLIKQCLQHNCKDMDLIISSGGVSVGDYDYIHEVVNSMGKIEQHNVAIKPGKPLCFGYIQHQDHCCLFFGLPGNPISAFVTLQNFFIPCIWQLSNCKTPPQKMQLSAILSTQLRKRAGRAEFQRGILSSEKDITGNINWTVASLCHQESHRIYNLSQANCHIVLSQEDESLAPGSTVTVEPFSWCFNA